MADINTTKNEEDLIYQIKKEGLGLPELPKYNILRIALALSLHLQENNKMPLNSKKWEERRLQGAMDGEYHLQQITGKGQKNKDDDFDKLIRCMLYIQNKEELDEENIDVFSNEEEYIKILRKYIQRGLYEIDNSWKINDCFYQWSYDHLDLIGELYPSSSNLKPETNSDDLSEKIKDYFKKENIDIEYVGNPIDSYRYKIYRIKVIDSNKINLFEKIQKNLDQVLGMQKEIDIRSAKGIGSGYDIQILKPEAEWEKISYQDFINGYKDLVSKNYELGIFVGFDILSNPFYFDLAQAPHIFVAGTTGSGKTIFLQNIILCLLKNNPKTKIIVVDPKFGIDYECFMPKIELIGDMNIASERIDTIIQDMENRLQKIKSGKKIECFEVLIVDELNDLLDQDKSINDKLGRLAQKSRQAGIHLVLGTQRPDAQTLKGTLRSNIPCRFGLRVPKNTDSRIILDESGAEKLSGKGDMYVKLHSDPLKRVFGYHLKHDQIKDFLDK